MKKILSILLSLLLLSSCNAYQKMDLENLEIDTNKRYKIITKNGTVIRSKMFINDDKTITFYHKKEKITMELSKIESINGRPFSNKQTLNVFLSAVSIIVIGSTVALAIILSAF